MCTLPKDAKTEEKPLINCHTHIFTGDSVPPFLAKTFVPWPFYFLLPVSLIVRAFRFWYSGPFTWQFKPLYKRCSKIFYKFKIGIARSGILTFLSSLVGLVLFISTFFILYNWLLRIFTVPDSESTILLIKKWLQENKLLFIPSSRINRIFLVIIFISFFKSGRNLLFFLLKKLWSFFAILPGPKTKELAKRYLYIGRFAFYKEQQDVLERLSNQYPNGSGFIILPMDMEFMEAGCLKKKFRYKNQMDALRIIKEKDEYKSRVFPFVFVDPRRLKKEGSAHFSYKFDNGKVQLENCFIKEYIEEHKFSGFKIYPALGYYPFDECLLPLWKYAADNGLPILTHCIRGTIYYRGKKDSKWDQHPVFEQSKGNGEYEPLLLPELKNRDFINNFTHPLNYLCLLDESLLRKVVGYSSDKRIKELFGFTDEKTELKYNLSHMKLCFGHFGGDDEWNRFIEMDRDNYSSQLVKQPLYGITFLTDDEGTPKPGKPEQIWKFVDWYSIIASIMLQYKNVYADLSYIIHSDDIQPLLKQTLCNNKLRKKVLFGTDFYVVRNHKSEKNMLADMIDKVDESDFKQIAITNPRKFLNNSLHDPVII